MRIWKIIMMMSLLCTVSISSFGCASKSDEAELSENQVVTVQRGNLVIDITAVGNLALSRTEDLAFDIFYQEGTVEEGDTVEEGQVLAKLDTSEWEDNLSVLEDQVTAEERDLLQKEINLRNAEIALDEARDIYTWPEIKVAQADVDDAEAFLQYVIDRNLPYASLAYAQARLTAAENKLDAMVNQYDTEQVAVKKLQLQLAQEQLEDARKALVDAQEELDEAISKSPLIVASFAGFITTVNVEGGDEVLTGTVAVQLADPEKFEADILVSEMDIYQVKLGGNASVQVDAMPMINLPAKVTHISPTATIQSGVVNYEVKVEIQSLEAVMQDISAGELPERLQQAVEEGSITQEQAEEMMKQQSGKQQEQAPTMLPEDFQLREGLTVTVSILVNERKDVLLVPNKAIIHQGGETYVQVLKDGVIEMRSIQTGISDWQFTEVTEGLSEGENVVIPETTTTPTAPTQGGPMPLFPGGKPH